MERKLYRIVFIIILMLSFISGIYAQGRPYEGPQDPAGDIAARREGIMNGNRILLKFKNTTELASWPNYNYSKWPNDHTGTGMLDGIALLIGARVYLKNDTIPVTDINEIQSGIILDTLYYCETSYRQGMDKNDAGTVEWGLYPVFGYFNLITDYPAMSNRLESWPPQGWPSRGFELKWPGEWDGRFGRGVMYADLETYFVANDAQDQEYCKDTIGVRYYPRPGVKIGDFDRDSLITKQRGCPWGGLGVRVKVRGYQWNNPQTRDALFWEYDISNISDYNLPEVAFGYWLDNGIGHEGDGCDQDDRGYYDKYENLAYSWDIDGIGMGGIKTGIMGITFLESPGLPEDGIDNDDDGLIDEKRDNKATEIIGPYDGISDVQKFMEWYGFSEDMFREHWDADEDQDWMDGKDINGNGVYDEDEDPGDDVGLDGVGPGELNYYGPDEGECNHKPDFLEGYGCEPNFAVTDISESDMLGLTSFELFKHPVEGEEPFMNFDEAAWKQLTERGLIEYFPGVGLNIVEEFGTGPFPLPQGRTERISMAEIHSYEKLAGLNSDAHSAPALFQKKRIVQFIYESDYRFASPPEMPTLTAIPCDGKVILTWDDKADRFTREPMLKNINDFEGYKLYKATDKYFSDCEVLMDMYGNPIGKKPIFQCDLKDGKKGACEFVLINGEAFYLGDDTGIQHYFMDDDVQNGRTYYYGIVAYDYGIEGIEVNIMPAENNLVVEIDEAENVRFTGKNVQIVTPRQQAAGYMPPSIKIEDETSLLGSGSIIPNVIDIQSIKANHKYMVKFQVDTVGHLREKKRYRCKYDLCYYNSGFSVYDITNGDSLVYKLSPERYPGNSLKFDISDSVWYFENLKSDPFESIQLNIESIKIAEFAPEKTGWVVGNSPIMIHLTGNASIYFPWEYEIIFTGEDSYVGRTNKENFIKGIDNRSLSGENVLLLNHSFNFYIINKCFTDSNGVYEKLDLVVHDRNENGVFDDSTDYVLVGHCFKYKNTNVIYWGGTIFAVDFKDAASCDNMPKTNDVFHIDFKRPFFATDSLVFSVLPPVDVDKKKLKSGLDDIKVVPNPYIVTNAMEPAISNPLLNQRRRLIFTHIPANCSIKIFTSSGVFVDEIEVNNTPDNGMVHWDMLTKENLEIAPGVYVYYVKSEVTGEEKLGKFAVIK